MLMSGVLCWSVGWESVFYVFGKKFLSFYVTLVMLLILSVRLCRGQVLHKIIQNLTL